MTFEQSIGFMLAFGLMSVGAIGCLVPGIPGAPLVLAVAVAHRLWFGAAGASNLILVLLVVLTLLALLLDYLATVYGARKFGATRKGIVGSVIGLCLGMFFGFFGIIAGPFIGAVVFEMMGGRTWEESSKAGFGAIIGLLAGSLGKFVCAITMMAIFFVNVWSRSFSLSADATEWLRWWGLG